MPKLSTNRFKSHEPSGPGEQPPGGSGGDSFLGLLPISNCLVPKIQLLLPRGSVGLQEGCWPAPVGLRFLPAPPPLLLSHSYRHTPTHAHTFPQMGQLPLTAPPAPRREQGTSTPSRGPSRPLPLLSHSPQKLKGVVCTHCASDLHSLTPALGAVWEGARSNTLCPRSLRHPGSHPENYNTVCTVTAHTPAGVAPRPLDSTFPITFLPFTKQRALEKGGAGQ